MQEQQQEPIWRHSTSKEEAEKQEESVLERGAPVVEKIFAFGDGHSHFYVEDVRNNDEEAHAICTVSNCWHGQFFNPKTHKLENGQIVDI